MDALDILLTASFWVAAIRIASPLIFATMGELICERAGVLNLGIEGIMTAGAFAGWFTVYAGGDLWTGVLVAALAGAMFGLLHATLTVPLGLSQHVVGIGVTLLATSLTYFTYRLLLPEVTSPPKIEPFQQLAIPGLSSIPVIGEALFSQTPLTYLAFLTMSAFNSFFFEMINGRGWICIALVVFGSWRPGKALLGAILFAAFDAYQIRLQQLSGGVVPYQIFLMMPYALSILALILVARRATYPKALMVPYQKGER